MTEITVATFNAGLLDGFIPHSRGRAGPVAAALGALDADLVALQEIWSEGDRRLVAETTPLGHVIGADPLEGDVTGFALDGTTGIMLLSRWPLLATSAVELPRYFTRRAVIVAEVDVPGGPVTVLATHLAANIRNVEHRDPGGWKGEHRTHVLEVLRLAAEASGPVLLAGDLNCGPERRDGFTEFAANYDLLRSGFETSAYADDPASTCTWCPDNPLNPFAGATILDHVMESGFRPLAWRRILDEIVEVDGDDGPVETTLSDHYGVAVTLALD